MERTAASRREFIGCVAIGAAAGSLAPAYRTFAGAWLTGPWRPRIGVCTSHANGPVLAQAGAAYIEDGVGRLLVPGKPDDDFESRLAAAQAAGVPVRACNSFLPGSLKCTGPDANHEGVLAWSETAFRRARRAGVETIVFGSSGARSIPDGFDRAEAERQFVALLKRMGPQAAAHGVTVCLEPLQRRETNFINTLPEGAKIVRQVEHPNVRLTADIFHMTREGEPPQHIIDAGDLIRHVHIAENRKRTAPGVDGQEFQPYLQALRQIGYDGPISLECGWQDLAGQLPVALRTLRAQIEDLDGVQVLLGPNPDFGHWQGEDGKAAAWTLLREARAIEVAPGAGSIVTRDAYDDFRLHVEFRTSKHEDEVRGQARGNSGVYLQRRYEVQILDSHGVESGARDCAALYGVKAPDENACRPPGEWQTYDIVFRAARWAGDGSKIANARITVHHNGVLVHDDVELDRKTGAGRPESRDRGPILLQDHGNKVQFRNIWIKRMGRASSG